jgi:hypothetical protein
VISVHDNHVYGFAVSFPRQRCVLHTKFPQEGKLPEFTDVVFEGVVAIQLDDICLTQSILGEIYEREPSEFFDAFEAVFKVEEKWNNKFSYLWLPFKYDDKNGFISSVIERSLRCFEIDSSWGLNGFVIASACTRVLRESEAEIV